VIVDIGTGDGRYVYRSASANPDKFYIGIDVQPKALEKVSEKIHRKLERGGLPNALFVQASVEELPAELDHVADEIHVHFPWGSLLRAVAVGDDHVLGGLRRIAAPGGWLEVLIGIDEVRDSAEARRLQLPPLTEEYVRSVLASRYTMAGFDVRKSGIMPSARWPHINTTWAKRLQNNRSRRLLFIIARATAGAHRFQGAGSPASGPPAADAPADP
jgi:16S rRNA (adenine(1408)-N(1))-methyltransferase